MSRRAMEKHKERAAREPWRNRIVGHGEQPASQFLANPLNWRIHPKAQREALTGVLSEVGWVQSVIVNRTTGNVVDGHARIEEALKLGDETSVPFIEVELSEEEEKQVLLTLDPISAMAAADKANLESLLQDVSTASSAVADMLTELAEKNGLEYGATIGGELEDVEPQVDRADELRQKWGVESGQIWQLGEHRLMCGDSTSADDVARLMNGDKADISVVDPPFELSTEQWRRWIMDPSVVFGQARHIRAIPDNLWRFERIIVKKYRHRSATVQIDHRHSFVVQVGSVKTLPHNAKTFPSVVEQEVERDHDHAKPLLILIEHLTEWVDAWNIVIDPFSGSGTTIMAAEKLGRKCRAMEIAPAYVAVALERWSQATGKTPELVA